MMMIVRTCVNLTGLNGSLVPNTSWLRDLDTSTAASMLEYGVSLGDIIPHMATLGHFPKNGS